MRGNVAYDINSVLCSDVRLNRKINGLIFHGPGDGFVVIFRDYNALEPFGVSDVLGKLALRKLLMTIITTIWMFETL